MYTVAGMVPEERARKRILITQPLFAWEALEDSPSLRTVREFLAAVPDAALLESLSCWRGRGRDDYPVSVLWGTLLLTVALRHASIESCLAELRRNEGLRAIIGIESESAVPKKWNMSRFLDVLGTGPHLSLLHEAFDGMVRRLAAAVPDLGERTAGDASALNARRERGKKVKGSGLPEPSGGRKEYVDDAGRVTHVVEWFGYKFHLLVDVKHEVILAYRITNTKVADSEALPDVLASAEANVGQGRIKTLAFDKAADDVKTHELLHKAGIRPVIQNRCLWKEELERKLPGHDARSNMVYDEAGTVYCYDKVSEPSVRRAMSYIGHEPSRGTLKYRCPARHAGFKCPSDKVCNAGKEYGMTVRVKREIDLRRFPPIPRATKQFERLYKGRTAVERVNARIKVFWGADDGNIVGARRFHAFLGAVMVVHAGVAAVLASAPRHEGTLGKTRLTCVAQILAASTIK